MFRDYVSPLTGIVLIGFSIYIFLWSLQLMINRDVPSSLLAALIGFVSLTGGIALIRTWSLSRYIAEVKEEKKSAGGSE